MSEKHGIRTSFLFMVTGLAIALAGAAPAEVLTLPEAARPEWLADDGIVMAGSWEPLLFRVRRDGSEGYEPTPGQREGYAREHSPEMVARLKELGVNFVMMHCYKGAGMAAEAESMADAVAFSKLCHDAGMRVGVYTYSGAFMWELFFKEKPEAKDWVLLNPDGSPVTYGKATYRYYWNRNHPDAQAYYRQIVRFAVEQIQTDLLHFDNYHVGPGWDPYSIAAFRVYLNDTFTPEQLKEMGITDTAQVMPPEDADGDSLLRRAWLDYSCKALADSYYDMSKYGRSLRKDVLVECNPGGVGGAIHAPVDHGRLLQGGEAYWDESLRPGYRDGKLLTRIRTFKVARRMDNIAFNYTTSPIEAAETMAFNRDCLGCMYWFEYGKAVERPGMNNPIDPDLQPFIRFFHQRRDLLRRAEVVADVAVLRSFPSQMFAPPEHAQLTQRVEQTLIEAPACFQIIYDEHLGELARYKALVLAGCVAMGDSRLRQIEEYVAGGGRVCIVGPAANHDEWMRPRAVPGLAGLPEEAVVRIPADGDILEGIRRACDSKPVLTLAGSGPEASTSGLCAEVTEQPGRRLVHLVNYRDGEPKENVAVALRLPDGLKADTVSIASPEHSEEIAVPVSQEGDVARFTVPRVNVYEIAVVTTR